MQVPENHKNIRNSRIDVYATSVICRSKAVKTVHHRLDEIRALPLEPIDFCQKWVKASPEERGYYAACVRELAQATGLSKRTIEGWGKDFVKRPDHVLHSLRKEDIIRQVRQLVLPDDAIEE